MSHLRKSPVSKNQHLFETIEETSHSQGLSSETCDGGSNPHDRPPNLDIIPIIPPPLRTQSSFTPKPGRDLPDALFCVPDPSLGAPDVKSGDPVKCSTTMGFMMASLKQTLSIVSNTTSSPLSPFKEKESLPVMESSPLDTEEDATLLESLKRTSVSKRKDQSDPVILSPFKQSFTNFLTRSLMTTPRQGLSRSPSNEIESCTSSCANEVIESSAACIEGPIFNTTILESSSRAGKNGIPDIVIQCIEHLERNGFLKTEGLYRVPGNVKRIKEIYNLFQDYYHRHHRRGSGLLRSSKANSRRNSITSARSSSSAALVDPDATLQPRLKRLPHLKPHDVIAWSELSISAISGSNPDLKMIEPPPQSHSVKQTRSRASSIGDSKSIISLGFEESRQGVGLWDEPGLYGTYGFPLSLDNEPPATIASLLKKFFSSVKGDFAPTQLWDSLNAIIQQQEHNQESNQSPSSTLIQSIRKLLKSAFPSQNHLHTFAYYFLHLQRVSSFANVNFMTPRNLITCTFINGGEGAVFLLCYADLVFGNVDLVGRDVVAMLSSGVENEAGEDGGGGGGSHNGEDSILEDTGLGKESCFLDRWLTNHVHASYGDRKQSLGTSANRDCSQ